MLGKGIRLGRVTKGGKAVILAFDHGFEHGPAEYEGVDMSPKRIVEIASKGGADAVILHKGMVDLLTEFPRDLGLIVKITARSNMSPKETEKQALVCSVEDAIAFGADAIAYTIYVGADREAEMLEEYEKIYHECKDYGIPVVGFMYPRPKDEKQRYAEKNVRYAARIGAELDADIIKTYYTGDTASFAKVVKDAAGKPVVAAGGPKKSEGDAVLRSVSDVMAAGASGVAVGRNIWMRENGDKFLKGVCAIVHEGKTAEQVESKYGL